MFFYFLKITKQKQKTETRQQKDQSTKKDKKRQTEKITKRQPKATKSNKQAGNEAWRRGKIDDKMAIR